MPSIDYRHLSPQERVELIGALRDGIEGEHIPLSTARTAELDRRVASFGEDLKTARPARGVRTELRNRAR